MFNDDGRGMGRSMETMLYALIDRYHPATIAAAEWSRKMDREAIDLCKGKPAPDAAVIDWVARYGVGRVPGLKVQGKLERFAVAMADAALRYFNEATFTSTTPESVLTHFAKLRDILGRIYSDGGGEGDRKLLSLTSKLLFLRMPEAAPIFDSQAETAIIFLVKLLKAASTGEAMLDEKGNVLEGTCENVDREWGWGTGRSMTREELDIYWYQDFFYSHLRVYALCHKRIEERLAKEGHEAEWLKPFRYFDKLLWVFGNKGTDYSLMSDAEESFKGTSISIAKGIAASRP
jgi:hypothetical protein